MALTFAPFGLRMSRALNGEHTNSTNIYRVANAVTVAIHRGRPVTYTAAAGAKGEAVDGTAPLLGVMQGAEWVDPTTKRPTWSAYIPAGTSSAGLRMGFSQPVIHVIDNPNVTFTVQANASVSLGDIGLNFNVTTLGEDSVNGLSRVAVLATSRTSANTGMLRCVGIVINENNNLNDPYPVIEVKLNTHLLAQTSGF